MSDRVQLIEALPIITFWELAAKLGKPEYALHKWIREGKIPRPRELGNTTFWTAQQIADWQTEKESAALAIKQKREANRVNVLARRAKLAREARWAKNGKPSKRSSPYVSA